LALKARIAGAILVLWVVASSLSYFGQAISYFNELLGRRSRREDR
jgi:hypothetical protein